MKRLNPLTGTEFKFGDVRADGKVFVSYRVTKPVSKKGTFYEDWSNPKSFSLRFEKSRVWAKNNPERTKEIQTNWVKENKNRATQLQKNWYLKNKVHFIAKVAKRRSAKKQRILPWLTQDHFEQIEDFYTIAKMFQMYTGQEYHVDHIVPLQGKYVSGFHAPWNLQVLPAKENLSKGNSHVV